jgi:hypothetical protein
MKTLLQMGIYYVREYTPTGLVDYFEAYSPLRNPASSTTKTGCYDITEILLKVALKHQK